MLHQIIKLGLPKLIKDYQGKMLGFGDKLSDEDIDSILAYIKTYWSEDIYNQHIKMSKN
jgi:mono/diheme cytochrome c family protein